MSIFSASLSDAELARSTDTFGCELGRRLEEAKADLAASRALVAELTGAYKIQLDCPNCRGQGCMACVLREVHDSCHDDCPTCGENAIERVLALTEADMLERLETK